MHVNRKYISPNFGERKGACKPEYVILHFTAMETADEACLRLCDPEFEVSAHYVIANDGEIFQLVEEEKRAWHAGLSYWAGQDDLNSRSIGIEISNNGARPFEDVQYETLLVILPEILRRWSIPPENILGHSDIAIGRKFDPGPWFDWVRLDQKGVSTPPKAKIDSDDFLELAASAGYQTDVDLKDLLLTIRLRHGGTPYYGDLRESDYQLLKK